MQVIVELQQSEAPEIVRSWVARLPPWVEIRKPQNVHRVAQLGEGESAALALSMEIKADLVLLDDLAARDAAESFGLKTAGTIGLIAQAHLRGWIEFETTLLRLRSTNYRISERVISIVRAKISKPK